MDLIRLINYCMNHVRVVSLICNSMIDFIHLCFLLCRMMVLVVNCIRKLWWAMIFSQTQQQTHSPLSTFVTWNEGHVYYSMPCTRWYDAIVATCYCTFLLLSKLPEVSLLHSKRWKKVGHREVRWILLSWPEINGQLTEMNRKCYRPLFYSELAKTDDHS